MRYSVLGPLEARDADDAVVNIGGPQQRRLLAVMLADIGQTLSADRLVECLWPDGLPPDRASRSVLTYVSRLRLALDGSISTVPEGYRFDLDASTLDSSEFESLLAEAGTAEPGRALELYDRALALWRGPAFGEYASAWWAVGESTRLDELRLVAMEERAEALLALGNLHRLIPELERLVATQPHRERPVALLMQALFASGRQADALRCFQTFRTRLVDDTGLDPSKELVELEHSIAAGRLPPTSGGRARLLRGYTVHETIGEGAFGRVFAATQPGTNREVAIKAIRPDLADAPRFIQQFEAEAQLVARLEHPHIVPLYDYWREPGGAYLVFRLLRGGTALGSLVADGPFSVERVSRLVEEAGGALVAAHSAGVVHCDVKPSNVMFDETGNAYLTDFGIAVAAVVDDLDGRRTRAYVAPELIGRVADTVQSDVFSFGCMVWELLAGTSPFSGPGAARGRVGSLTGLIAGPCEAIDAVIAKATAADPAARYGSTAEFILGWREAIGRPDGVLTPMGPYATIPRDSRRRAEARALVTATSAAVNPYKGLRSFGEADANDFFGRTDAALQLDSLLRTDTFVAVVGPSGSGKSSLVHAGVVPLLRRRGLCVATMVPGSTPLVALRQALRDVASEHASTTDLVEMLTAVVAGTPDGLVLVVDQFEECWTLASADHRDRFLATLAAASDLGVRCVVTIRADLYDRPLRHPVIGEFVARCTFPVPPMSPLAIEDAVVEPAHRNGISFDDGVVSTIVAEASGNPAALPLLQFAMAELYEGRTNDCVSADALQRLGGLGGAIGRRAEEIYTDLDEAEQQNARRLFGRLVAPGLGGPDTRRRARYSELSDAELAVTGMFVHARLLVADRDAATREPVVEVAHEALLVNWPRLDDWLETDRQWLAQLQHLSGAAQSWDEAGRADSELYRGSRLEAILETAADHSGELNADEQAFIDASRLARDAGRERERRRTRRLRISLVATASLLVLALIAGTIAWRQRQHADSAQREAKIEALVGRSLALRATQRDAAALLALEANRLADTPRTRSALFATFTATQGALGVDQLPPELGDGPTKGIVLPDGKTAFVAGGDPRQLVRPYDLATGEVDEPWPQLLNEGNWVQRLISSRDGRLLVLLDLVDSGGTEIGVYDTQSHALVTRPPHVSRQLDNGTFSPDGTRLYVSGGPNGDVTVYSIPDGTIVGELAGFPHHPDSNWEATTAGLAFVDGGLLAVGSTTGTVRLVDPIDLTDVRSIEFPPGTSESLVAFDGGKSLIGEGPKGRIRWDVGSPTPKWYLDETFGVLNSGPQTYPCAIAEQIDRFYCGDAFGRLDERDLANGGLVRLIDAQSGNAGTLWINPDGTELVSFGASTHIVSRWRLDGSGPVSRRSNATNDVPVAYSPDGKRLIVWEATSSGGGIGDPAVIDAMSGKLIDSLDGWGYASWTGDETVVLAGAKDGALALQTYDVVNKTALAASAFPNVTAEGCPPHNPYCQVGTIFAGQRRLWMEIRPPGVSFSQIWTIDIDTLQRIEPTFRVFGLNTASGNDDGTRVVISSDEGTMVFDGQSGAELGQIEAGMFNGTSILSGVTVAAGSRLIATTLEGDVIVYDIETREVLHTLSGTRGYSRVAVTPDGSLAMATGDDHSVTLYDLASGDQIGDRLIISNAEAVSSALRPDGMELAIGGGFDRDFLVWDLDPAHWAMAACTLAGRNLTPEEWDNYIGDLAEYHSTCPQYD